MKRRRPRRPPLRPLVLLLDGHDDTRELYADALKCFGFETTTLSDGIDVSTQVRQTDPDIIVTELLLPWFDGWAFVRDIKRNARTRDIPVVIVTSDARESAREQAQREGCAAFLVKPCLPDQLAIELLGVLHQAHANRHRPIYH